MNIQACHNPDMTFGRLLSTDGLLTFSLYTDWTTTAFAVWIMMFMLFYVFFDFCIFHFVVNATGTRNMSGILSIVSCIIAIIIASSVTSKVNSCTNESTTTMTEPKFVINVLLLCVVALSVYTDFSVGTKSWHFGKSVSVPLTQITKYVSIFFLAYYFLFSQSEEIKNTATVFFWIFFATSLASASASANAAFKPLRSLSEKLPKLENPQTDIFLQRGRSFSEFLSAIILLPVWIHMEGRSTDKTLADLATSVKWVNVSVAIVLFVAKQAVLRVNGVALIDPITTSLNITMAIGVFAAFLELSFDRLFYGSQIACNEISKSMSHVVTSILYVAFFALLSRHWTDGLGTDALEALKEGKKALNAASQNHSRVHWMIMTAILVLFIVFIIPVAIGADSVKQRNDHESTLKKLGTGPKILSIHTYNSEADLEADIPDITIPSGIYYNVSAEKTGNICRDVFADQKDGAKIGAFTEPNCGVPSGKTDTDTKTGVRSLVNNKIPTFSGSGGSSGTSKFVSVFFKFDMEIERDSFNYQDVTLCGATWETLNNPIKRINDKLYYANIRPLCWRDNSPKESEGEEADTGRLDFDGTDTNGTTAVERCPGNQADGMSAMRIHVPKSSFKTAPDDTYPKGVANKESKDFMIFYLMRPKITIKLFKTRDGDDDRTALINTINTEAASVNKSNPMQLTHDNLPPNPRDATDDDITPSDTSFSTRHAMKPRVVVLFELDHKDNDFDFTDVATLKARLLQDKETSKGIIKSFSRVEETQGTNESDPIYELLHVTYIQGTTPQGREQTDSPRLLSETTWKSTEIIEHTANSKIAFVLKIKETATSAERLLFDTKLTMHIPENTFSDRFDPRMKNVTTDSHHWYHFARMIVNMYIANGKPQGHPIAYSSSDLVKDTETVPNNDKLLRDETGVEGVFYIDTSKRISSDKGLTDSNHPFSLAKFSVDWKLNKEGIDDYSDVNAVSSPSFDRQNVYWCKKIERINTDEEELLKNGIVERYKLTVKQVTKFKNADGTEELLVPNPKPDECSVKFLEDRSCNWAVNNAGVNTTDSLFRIDSGNTSPRQDAATDTHAQTEEAGMCEGVFAQNSTLEDYYRRYAANFVRYTTILISITIFWMFTTVIMFISDGYWTGVKTLLGGNATSTTTEAGNVVGTAVKTGDRRILIAAQTFFPPKRMNHFVFFMFWMVAATSLFLMIWLIIGEASQAPESALSLISIAAVTFVGIYQIKNWDRISSGELLAGKPFQFFVFFYNIAAITVLAVILWFTYSQYESNGTLDSFNPLLNLDWKLKLTWTRPPDDTVPTANLDANDLSDIRGDTRDPTATWIMNKNNTQLSKKLTGNFDINEAKTSITTFYVIFFLALAWLIIMYLVFGVIGSSIPIGFTDAVNTRFTYTPHQPKHGGDGNITAAQPVQRSRVKFADSPGKGFRKDDAVPDFIRAKIVNPIARSTTLAIDASKAGFIMGHAGARRMRNTMRNSAAGTMGEIRTTLKVGRSARGTQTSSGSSLVSTGPAAPEPALQRRPAPQLNSRRNQRRSLLRSARLPAPSALQPRRPAPNLRNQRQSLLRSARLPAPSPLPRPGTT